MQIGTATGVLTVTGGMNTGHITGTMSSFLRPVVATTTGRNSNTGITVAGLKTAARSLEAGMHNGMPTGAKALATSATGKIGVKMAEMVRTTATTGSTAKTGRSFNWIVD
jgi:hypothetical protein